MKKFIFASVLCMSAAVAFAGPGYYESRTSNCSPESMQRAVDAQSARNRAVISVVKCDASPAPAPRIVRRAPAPRVVPCYHYDTVCDCCL